MLGRDEWGRHMVERLRGRAGKAQRIRRLKRTYGLCEMCEAEGKVSVATVVNHKAALAHGGTDDDSNTENLCRTHDLEVTAKQFGYKAPRQETGVDGWKVS